MPIYRRLKGDKKINGGYIAILVTFLISGLWHGANWTFVLWGGINGTALVVDKITKSKREKLRKILKLEGDRLFDLFQIILTFIFIVFTGIFLLDGVFIIY